LLQHCLLGPQLRKLLGETEWEDSFEVRKDKEHFIFTVQSTGAACLTPCEA
jgi:RNA polymerase Rpb3/Rpb11 dimerisation domain